MMEELLQLVTSSACGEFFRAMERRKCPGKVTVPTEVLVGEGKTGLFTFNQFPPFFRPVPEDGEGGGGCCCGAL